MIRLRPEEHGAIAKYIHGLCGVTLDGSKTYLIEARLADLVEETGCTSFSQFLTRTKAHDGKALDRRVVDAITTNETSFFRDTTPFDLLRHKILPELIDQRQKPSGRIRIWSAACSTGQELYSIAIVCKELLGDPDHYGVRLVGTDISDEAVSRASKGLYGDTEISRGLSDEQREKYFIHRADGWQICDEIRYLASFKKLNLMHDFSGLGKFNVIFCRNVAIYFNDADRLSLFERIGWALEPKGYLVIGALESLNGICPQLESKRYLRSSFYKARIKA